MSLFSKKNKMSLEQWMFYGIRGLNKTDIFAIDEYDKKRVLDTSIKSMLASKLFIIKNCFYILSAMSLCDSGKLKVESEVFAKNFMQVLYQYLVQTGDSQSDAISKIESIQSECEKCFEFISNNSKDGSEIDFWSCKYFADTIITPKINIDNLDSTINQGYINSVVMNYSKHIYLSIMGYLEKTLKQVEIVAY